MISLLLLLLVIVLFAMVAFWLVGKMGLQEPARTIALVIVGVICLLALFNWLPVGAFPRGRFG